MEHHHHHSDPTAANATESPPSSSSSGGNMVMTFFQATNTPLLFDGTAPTNAGQYAGACIVLVLLGVLACVLINMKAVLQRGVWAPVAAAASHEDPSLLRDDEKAAAKTLNSMGAGSENGPVLHTHSRPGTAGEMGLWWAAWKGTTVMQRVGMATYEVVLVGLGYVLMLAVMTMNVSYFLSVLAGIWIGTALLGAATPAADGLQHC
ncbi:Ctr copper transporter family-domain-containing protein [Immersiella caudata]|uniref:Copper transport protein n=1 Tax=Immersiella caudata TaxID=314043 RepID=A0AA40C2N9_9PEZI|nr:Ctr copper transporter family-domain-containing protein [Immersiella caudata]